MDDQAQDILILSTGVELELRTPSPVLVVNAMRAIMKDEPKAPKVFVEAKGREEENPADPTYQRDYQIWSGDAVLRALRSLIPTGSKLHVKPDGMVGPEDDDFVDLMESIGEVPATGVHSRYVQWVLLIAASKEDLSTLGMELMRRAGVREEDALDAQEMFPGLPKRGADNGTSPERDSEHRDSVRTPSSGASAGN